MKDTITLPVSGKHILPTEETLLKETEKLARIGSWQYNFQTGIGKWSEQAYLLLGYEPGTAEPSFKSLLERIHPDDLGYVKKCHNEIEEKGLSKQKFEHRIIDYTTGEIRHLITELIFERDALGQPLQARGYIQDITSSKYNEDKLVQSQSHLLTSQRIANIGSWEMKLHSETRNDDPVYWSTQTYRIFRQTPKKYSPTFNNFLKMVHPEDRPILLKKLDDSVKSGQVYNLTHRIILPDGSERIVHQRGEMVYEKHTQKAVKMIGTCQDITDRIEEEHAYQVSDANFRTIFDNTTTSYILVDHNLKIVSFNKAAYNGFSENSGKTLALGSDLMDYILDEKKLRATEMYKRVFKGEQFKLEDYYTKPDGDLFWYYLQLLPVFGTDGSVLNMVIYLKDISEQKRTEAERDKVTADLIQRNKDLEQFSYIISHNLRQPIANILGITNNFNTHSVKLSEECRDVMEALDTSARRLDEVILDLNHILQVRNDGIENKQKVSLSEVVKYNQINLGYLIKKENAIIEYDFSEIDEITTMKSYIYSIFYNLISNGIKYRQANRTPMMKICSKQFNNKVILTFTDNGLGIDLARKANELFGLYKRFHNHIAGKGVGLYLVKAQVERLGGTISVSSKVNQGTTFTIELEQK